MVRCRAQDQGHLPVDLEARRGEALAGGGGATREAGGQGGPCQLLEGAVIVSRGGLTSRRGISRHFLGFLVLAWSSPR
eukprot:80019-Prymnesium_polylepis.1